VDRRLLAVSVVAVVALALTGCVADSPGQAAVTSPSPTASATPTPTPTPVDPLAVVPLPAAAKVDYQLGGAYDPAPDVTVVARDSGQSPVQGVYSICYVNGFQTQPGDLWPNSLVLHDAAGEKVVDPDWPDETILDISTPDNRAAIADRVAVTVAGCAGAGFDAVEFDNLDSFTRAGGAFGIEDAVAYADLLVTSAHRAGLAVGQKNTPELGARGRDEIGFDFAVAEECQRYDECAAYTAVYGDQVIDIEYSDNMLETWTAICADPQLPPASVLRDRKLLPDDKPGYVAKYC